MAKKGVGSEANYLKIGLLVFGLVVFLGWRFLSGGFNLPTSQASEAFHQSQVLPVVPVPIIPVVRDDDIKTQTVAIETQNFMDYLIEHYRPRLSVTAFHPDRGFMGDVDFYDNGVLVERYPISALHSLGVALVRKTYGADLVFKGKTYIVTAWKLIEDSLSTASIEVVK